jgi:hypothetical protein
VTSHRHLFVSACALIFFAHGSALAASQPVEVLASEFGLFDASNPSELAFEPVSVVPRKEGQRYGWSIELRSTKRSLLVTEEYLLPDVAKPPSNKEATQTAEVELLDLPPQRRHQVSQRQLVPVDGRIYGEWAMGPNEPSGRRHLRVTIENSTSVDFVYDVD